MTGDGPGVDELVRWYRPAWEGTCLYCLLVPISRRRSQEGRTGRVEMWMGGRHGGACEDDTGSAGTVPSVFDKPRCGDGVGADDAGSGQCGKRERSTMGLSDVCGLRPRDDGVRNQAAVGRPKG